MRREREFARHRHLAATDEVDVGAGVVRRPEGTGGHDGSTGAGAAGAAVYMRDLNGLCQSHGGQHGGEPGG